jgi:hypothetical protein
MLITPSEIEKVALDITTYWDKSQLSDDDKKSVLTMIMDYYNDKNEYVYEKYLSKLIEVELAKHDKGEDDG